MDFAPKTNWVDGDEYNAAATNRVEAGVVEGIGKAEAAQAASATNAAAITATNTAVTATNTALTAGLAAKASFVLVTTGTEARPAGNYCLWVDVPTRSPITQPTNMGANDTWLPAGPPADTVPPSVPTGLASSNVADTSFTLTWTASTGDPTLYEVFKGGVSVGTTASTSLPITGLTASTAYSMTVRARDAAGNWSAQSSALSVTTGAPASTPTVKETLQTADGNTAAATLTTSSLVSGNTIIAYQITDNTVGNTPAVTSSAGTATQIVELVWDSNKTLRAYRIPVTSSGTKTVTFPNAGGFDNLGIVRVFDENITVDAYASAATSGTAITSPAVTGLSGSADRLDVVLANRSDFTATDAALTQRGNPKVNSFLYTWVGDKVLTAGGTSPTYAFTCQFNVAGGCLVLGYKA